MSVLKNTKHERFAQELASGKTSTDAYEAAGYKPNRSHASRLVTKGNIAERVAELQGRAADGVVISKQWVIERLVQNVDRAMQAEPVLDRDGKPTGEYQYQGSVANRSLELLGKEIGMFADRTKVAVNGNAFLDFLGMCNEKVKEHQRGLKAKQAEEAKLIEHDQ